MSLVHLPRTRLTLANRITIGRALTVPVFILLVVYYIAGASDGRPNEYLRWAATFGFTAAALSDALDGYFARARRERTRLGTVLDPLADKALLLAGVIVLSGSWGAIFRPHIPLWYMWLVITRDALLIVGTAVIHVTVGHATVTPRYAGKAATFLQMLIVLWVLVGWSARGFLPLLWVAAACTLVSAGQYVADGVRQLEKAMAHEEPRKKD
jgi:cardiolipin synthase (CMP-forming)